MREIGTLWRASGKISQVFPHDGKKFTLEELQGFVGGHIEKVPNTARRGKPIAYCNEDGRLKDLPFNPSASTIFGIILVGDVIQVQREP
jgi:uncharacterized protein DUF3846